MDDGQANPFFDLFVDGYTHSVFVSPDMVVRYSVWGTIESNTIDSLYNAYYYLIEEIDFLDYSLGDVTMDGLININDILSIVNYMLGYNDYEMGELNLADINGDNEVSILDIIQIVNLILE